jgi:choline kinase
LVFTLNGVNQNINDFYKWIQVDILEYVKENFIVKKSDIVYDPVCCKIIFKSNNACTGITSFDFGDNTKTKVVTINNIHIFENIKYFTYIPIQTSEKNLVDFASNNVSFNIENIINGISYDIRAVSVNGTSGIYTIKHILCLY